MANPASPYSTSPRVASDLYTSPREAVPSAYAPATGLTQTEQLALKRRQKAGNFEEKVFLNDGTSLAQVKERLLKYRTGDYLVSPTEAFGDFVQNAKVYPADMASIGLEGITDFQQVFNDAAINPLTYDLPLSLGLPGYRFGNIDSDGKLQQAIQDSRQRTIDRASNKSRASLANLNADTAGNDQEIADRRAALNEANGGTDYTAIQAKDILLGNASPLDYLRGRGEAASDQTLGFFKGARDYVANPYGTLMVGGQSAGHLVGAGMTGAIVKSAAKSTIRKGISKEIASGKLTQLEAAQLLPGRLSRGSQAAGVKGVTGYVAASEGGSVAAEYKLKALGTSFEDLKANSPVFNNLIANGYSEENARRKIAQDGATYTGIVNGILAGAITKFTGAGALESNLFKDLLNKDVLKHIDMFGREFVEEGLQSGTGQAVSNQATQKFLDAKQRILEGTGNAAAEGAFASLGTTAAVSGAPPAVVAAAKLTGKGVGKGAKVVTDRFVPDSVKDKVEDKVISKLSREAVLNEQAKSYNPETAVRKMAMDYEDVPEQDRRAYLNSMQVHIDNLRLKAKAADQEAARTGKKKDLNSSGQINRHLENAKKAHQKFAAELGTTNAEDVEASVNNMGTKDFTQEDIDNVTEDVRFNMGSEGVSKYSGILNNPEAPTAIKDLILSVAKQQANDATRTPEVLAENTKTADLLNKLNSTISSNDPVGVSKILAEMETEVKRLQEDLKKSPDDEILAERVDIAKDRFNVAKRAANLELNRPDEKVEDQYDIPEPGGPALDPEKVRVTEAIKKQDDEISGRFRADNGESIEPGLYTGKDGTKYTVARNDKGQILITGSKTKKVGTYTDNVANETAAKFAKDLKKGKIELTKAEPEAPFAREALVKEILDASDKLDKLGVRMGHRARAVMNILKGKSRRAASQVSTSDLQAMKRLLTGRLTKLTEDAASRRQQDAEADRYGSEDSSQNTSQNDSEVPTFDLEEEAFLEAAYDEQATQAQAEEDERDHLNQQEQQHVDAVSPQGAMSINDLREQQALEELEEGVTETFSVFSANAKDTVEAVIKELQNIHSRTSDADFKAKVANLIVAMRKSNEDLKAKKIYKTTYSLDLKLNKQLKSAVDLLNEFRTMDITEQRDDVKAKNPQAANADFFKQIASLARTPYKAVKDSAAREKLIRDLVNHYLENDLTLEQMDEYAGPLLFNFYLNHGFASPTQAMLNNRYEHFPDSNLPKVSDVYTTRGKATSAFAIIPNFFNQISKGKHKAALRDAFNLSTGESKALNTFIAFAEGYTSKGKTTEGFSDIVQRATRDNLTEEEYAEDVLQWFKTRKGDLPQNIVDAISMGVFEYVGTRASETILRDERGMNALLNRSSDKFVTTATEHLLQDTGVLRTVLAGDLGKSIAKQLNISTYKQADGNMQARFEQSLGLLAIEAMVQAGMMENTAVSQQDLNTFVREDYEIQDLKDQASFLTFNRIFSENGQPVGRVADIIEAYKNNENYRSTFSKVFGLVNERPLYLDEPKQTVSEFLGSTLMEPSDANKEAMQAGQNIEWGISGNAGPVMSALTENDMELIGGKKDASKEHILDEKSVNANNAGILAEIRDLQQVFIRIKDDASMYFGLTFWPNLRQGDTNKISLQRNKIQRFAIVAKHWRNTIKLDGGLATDVEAIRLMNNTKIAIIEGLDGYKGDNADKVSPLNLLNTFHTTVMSADGTLHPKFKKAILALQNVVELEKAAKASPEDADAAKALTDARKAIVAGSKDGKHKAHSLAALITAEKLYTAIQNKSDSVLVDLPREIDGVTNGVITANIQIGGGTQESQDIIAAGGLSVSEYDSNGERLFENHIRKEEGKFDAYQTLALTIEKFLSDLRIARKDNPELLKQLNAAQMLIGSMLETNDSGDIFVTPEGRNLSKDPLMLTSYGASMQALIDSFNYKGIKTINYAIMDAVADGDTAKLKNIRSALRVIFNDDTYNFAYDQNKSPTENARTLVFTAYQVEQIEAVYTDTYGEAIRVGTEKQLGKLLTNRGFMNASFRVMNEVFVALVDDALDQIREVKGEAVSPAELRDILLYLRDRNLLPGAAHASTEEIWQKIQVTNSKKVNVPKEEGGNVRQRYAEPHNVTIVSLDENNQTSETTRKNVRSSGETIKTEQYIGDPGQAGAAVYIQSFDANVQLDVIREFIIQNIHDASMMGIQDSDQVGHAANQSYNTRHNTWNMFGQIEKSLQPFFKVLNDMKQREDPRYRAISGKIHAAFRDKPITVVKGDYDRGDYGITYKTLKEFRVAFNDAKRSIYAGRVLTLGKYKVWDQYPGGGTQFYPDHPGELPKAQPNKSIPKGIKEDGEILEDYANKPQATAPQSKRNKHTFKRVFGKNQTATGYGIQLTGLTEKISVIKLGNAWGIAFTETGDMIRPNTFRTKADALRAFQEFNDHTETVEELNTMLQAHQEKVKNQAGYGSEANAQQHGINTNAPAEHVTAEQAIPIFDRMDNVGLHKETQEHSSYLRGFINSILSPGLRAMDLLSDTVKLRELNNGEFNRGSYDYTENTIYVDAAQGQMRGAVDMSAQEVYVHELTHAVLGWGINHIPKVRLELERLFDLAEADSSITYKSFLQMEIGPDGNQRVKVSHGNTLADEERLAQDRYDYIFNTSRENYLHEFATIGLTNEAFKAALGKVKNIKKKTQFSGGLLDRLAQTFAFIIEQIEEKLTGTNPEFVDAALYNLADNINKINTQNKNIADRAWEKLYGYNPLIQRVLTRYLVKPADWYAQYSEDNRDPNIPNDNWAKHYFDKVFTLPYGLYHAFLDGKLDDVIYEKGQTKDNPVHKLAVEMAGANKLTQPFFTTLQLIKHRRDSAVEQEATGIAKQILEAVDSNKPLTEEQWEHVNAGLLKTDLVSIFEDYTHVEISQFFRGNTKLSKEEARLHRQLRRNYPELAEFYIIQATSLGHEMAQGKVGLGGQQRNAFNIAQASVTDIVPTGDLLRAEKVINTLATLSAIKNTSPRKRASTAEFIQHEMSRTTDLNAVQIMMDLHREQQRESLEKAFQGDKTQTVKGFTTEMYDKYKSVKFAPRWQEGRMKQQGYVRYAPLNDDPNSTLAEGNWIYISRTDSMNPYVTGLFGLQDNAANGTDLLTTITESRDLSEMTDDQRKDFLKIAHKQANAAIKQMRIDTEMEIQRQVDGTAVLDYKSNHVIPIMSGDGTDMVNFRYTMSEEMKNTALGKRDQAHLNLGRMTASVTNKVETVKSSQAALQIIYNDFVENYSNDPRGYTEIGPEAPTEKGREHFRLLPHAAKEQMFNMWGDDKMMVRTDMLDLTFGYRKLSFTDVLDKFILDQTDGAYGLNHFIKRAMKTAGLIWKAIVATAKKNVVIFLPVVFTANFVSNQLLLMMNGVGPVYMLKKQAEAVTAIIKYQKDIKRQEELRRLIKSDPSHANTARRKILLDRVTDAVNRNVIKELIDVGTFQSIVEDISLTEDELRAVLKNAFPRTGELVEAAIDKIPATARNAGKVVMIDKSTALSDFLLKATQYSDFVGRYALYKHMTEERGKDRNDPAVKKHALEVITDTFIDYDVPTSPEMQWLNDMGLLMYTKYYFRIQRIIMRMLLKRTGTTAMLAAIQGMTGVDTPDTLDGFITPWGIYQKFNAIPVERLYEASVIPAASYLFGIPEALGF